MKSILIRPAPGVSIRHTRNVFSLAIPSRVRINQLGALADSLPAIEAVANPVADEIRELAKVTQLRRGPVLPRDWTETLRRVR